MSRALIGERFGRLVVVRLLRRDMEHYTSKERGPRSRPVPIYECLCDCGRTKEVKGREIGRTVHSCGCLARDTHAKRGGEGWVTRVVKHYRLNAKKKRRDFCLSWDQVKALITEPCHYCGASPPPHNLDCWRGVRFHGIDRVDNARGYVPGNVVTACKECNYGIPREPLPDSQARRPRH
jgi:hypothetical protein